MNEQYSPGFGGLFAGNPELEPEKSRSGELGLEFTPGAGQRLKAQSYSTRIRNLISFSGADFRAENIARARIDGAELATKNVSANGSLHRSLTVAGCRATRTPTANLLRRPKQN